MRTKAHFHLLVFLISLLGSIATFAQDQIHKKNQEVIHCKVKEIGLDEIKYNLPSPDDEILFSIGKDKVLKIVFENGETILFKDEFENIENYVDNKKNALKIDFMSPLTGNTTFAYERSLQPGRSFEASLGIIGLGNNVGDLNAFGFFTRFGMKFIKSPDFYLRGMRYAHILKGSYVKPEIAFGYYAKDFENYDYFGYTGTTRGDVITGAIFLNFGKQWIYNNSFLVDYFFGFGYGFDSGPNDGDYHYGYVIAPSNFPIALQTGFKIGFLFK